MDETPLGEGKSGPYIFRGFIPPEKEIPMEIKAARLAHHKPIDYEGEAYAALWKSQTPSEVTLDLIRGIETGKSMEPMAATMEEIRKVWEASRS